MPNPVELNDYGKPLTPQDHSSQVKDLLKKNSLDIKRERKIETVDFEEINKIIFNLEEPGEYGNAYKKIGLSPRAFNDDKNKGKARLVTKFALLGLLAQQQNHHEFTFDELAIIFAALIHHCETRAPQFRKEVKEIQKTIANLMLEKEI
jgi:hypothetical protein